MFFVASDAKKPTVPQFNVRVEPGGRVDLVADQPELWSLARHESAHENSTPQGSEVAAEVQANVVRRELHSQVRREPVWRSARESLESGGLHDVLISMPAGDFADRHGSFTQADGGHRKPSEESTSDGGTESSSDGGQKSSSDGGSMGMGIVLGVALVLGVIALVCFIFRNTIQMYFGMAQMGQAASRGDAQGVINAGGGVAKCATKAVTSGVAFKVGQAGARAGADHAAKAIPKAVPKQYQQQVGEVASRTGGAAQAAAKAGSQGYQAAKAGSQGYQPSVASDAAASAASSAATQAAQISSKMPTTPKMPGVPTGIAAMPPSVPVFKGPA